jgi:hypothetical protein
MGRRENSEKKLFLRLFFCFAQENTEINFIDINIKYINFIIDIFNKL